MLESKTNKDIATEQKLAESQLATARARVKEIERLYEKVYEDNVNGKVSDEWFMKLSHKYEVEMDGLHGVRFLCICLSGSPSAGSEYPACKS